MSKILCHHNGKYNFYSTVADGFCFESSLTIDQVEEIIGQEFGQEGIDRLPDRLKRTHENGCSAYGETLESLLTCNRAGDDETHLSMQKCIDRFLS